MFIFTDIGNKKIYTKQINLDGTATLNTYSLVEDTNPSENFITRAELESAIAQIRKEMSERSETYVSEQPKQQQQSAANVVKPIREQPAF
jgi:predicted transcriptional regulator